MTWKFTHKMYHLNNVNTKTLASGWLILSENYSPAAAAAVPTTEDPKVCQLIKLLKSHTFCISLSMGDPYIQVLTSSCELTCTTG